MKRFVLIIGAAGGVGIEVAARLAGRFELICSVRNKTQKKVLLDRVPGLRRIVIMALDDNRVIRTVLKRCLDHGPIDLAAVVVCAANCPNGPLEIAPIPEFMQTLQVNVVSHLAIYQQCMPSLRKSKGRLIFVSSYSGKVGMPFTGVYVASKFALEGLADVMRREAGKWGVDIVLIEPGGIKTNMALKQIAHLQRNLQALPANAKKLYGDLYRQFERLVECGYPIATSPRIVAKTIETALLVTEPKTRYPVGADAKGLLRMNRRLSDRQIDRVCRDVFDAAGKLPRRPQAVPHV